MNYCPQYGYLVGARYAIPSDPTECDVPNAPPIGCNRLRCLRCDTPVRHTLAGDANPEARLYTCNCSHWTETGVQPLEDEDPESYRVSPDVPWRCEGHPLITLPHHIDGALIETPADLAALAHRALHAAGPDPAFLLRLHARLAPADAAALTAALLPALDEPNPVALRFFLTFDHPPARARLVERFSAAPQVDGLVWRVLASGIESEEPVRQFARSAALAGHGDSDLFRALATADPEWLLINSQPIARASLARAEELFDSLSQVPDKYLCGPPNLTRWHSNCCAVVRYIIADSISLEQALERTRSPLATWDGNEVYRTRLAIFAVSDSGAMSIKSAEVEPATFESWNDRARARGGRVGASHTHSEVVWAFDDDDCGVWNKSRRIVRGDRRRLLLQGSYTPTELITGVSSFIDASPEAIHRGVRCTLADGRQLLLHEEHDDDPPQDPDYSGEAADWESEWVWQLARDLATWLGVPLNARGSAAANARQLEVRARLLDFAAQLGPAPASCHLGRYDDCDLNLRWDPASGQLTFARTIDGRTWERVEKHGAAPDAAAWLRHFITPRRLLAATHGGY